jgi:hypothetical protein
MNGLTSYPEHKPILKSRTVIYKFHTGAGPEDPEGE